MALFARLRVATPMRPIILTLVATAAIAGAGCNRGNGDKLTDEDVAAASQSKGGGEQEGADPRCESSRTHDVVKREMFRRAAEIRGSNAASYARIADFAMLQIFDAAPTAAASVGAAVECRGRATLRLPPNLSVAGGRTSLAGSIGFSVGGTAKGANPVISLTDDESITIPLATLRQKRASEPPASAIPPSEPAEPFDQVAPPAVPAPPPPRPAPIAPEPVATAVRPSFDCRSARTRGEIAVCASPLLAELDQTMAAQYRAAIASADAPKARLLRETRDRFLGYRDRCPDDACVATTYRGRMREIADIMAGRWRGR